MPETDEPSEGKGEREREKREDRGREKKTERQKRAWGRAGGRVGAQRSESGGESARLFVGLCLFLIPGMRVYSLSSPRVNPRVMAVFFFFDRAQLVVSP